ncbi:MAG: SURF1 family protein [Chloroflexi bacterium]|nr:MAG: SURF1 family protein [Chloroflexota bacterium]
MSQASIQQTGKALVSRRWLLPTIFVLVGMILLVRLGFWQLDRLKQRRAENAQLTAVLEGAPLHLPQDAIPEDEAYLHNRDVVVTGTFDFANEGFHILQQWDSKNGVHLITPLLIDGSDQAILVDRGFIPDAEVANASSYATESGQVTVSGYVALSEIISRPRTSDGDSGRANNEWYRVDVAAIEAQLPYDLYPFYIVVQPTEELDQTLPYEQPRNIDLSQGNHLSYALQWFIFTGLLGIVYVSLVRRRLE